MSKHKSGPWTTITALMREKNVVNIGGEAEEIGNQKTDFEMNKTDAIVTLINNPWNYSTCLR